MQERRASTKAPGLLTRACVRHFFARTVDEKTRHPAQKVFYIDIWIKIEVPAIPAFGDSFDLSQIGPWLIIISVSVSVSPILFRQNNHLVLPPFTLRVSIRTHRMMSTAVQRKTYPHLRKRQTDKSSWLIFQTATLYLFYEFFYINVTFRFLNGHL